MTNDPRFDIALDAFILAMVGYDISQGGLHGIQMFFGGLFLLMLAGDLYRLLRK